jgi:hypothetical protein
MDRRLIYPATFSPIESKPDHPIQETKMDYMTFNDMLRRTAWRLPDHPFLYWSDRQRSLT